jgi:phosphoglycolate phosphatase-like HAD superfamily hydrolase/phosphoheptose isomerase
LPEKIETAPELVIMDFDGTLVDSRETLAEISRDVLARFGIVVDPAEIRSLVGMPTGERFRRHGVPPERLRDAVAAFDEAHGHHDYTGVEPVPGLREWLEDFAGTRKWILSTCPERPLLAALERLSLRRHFERVICRTGTETAGKTEKLRQLAPLPVDGPIWYFGDEVDDLQAGNYVGAVSFLVEREHNRSYRFLADFSLSDYRRFRERLADRQPEDLFAGYIGALQRGLSAIDLAQVTALAERICAAAVRRGTIYIAGNGGCHSILSHFALDLRRSFLTAGGRSLIYVPGSSPETVSAFSNDLGWCQALRNEVASSLSAGDLVVLLSTSGRSPNLQELADWAELRGAEVFGAYPQTVLRTPAQAIAPLLEDILGAFCHITSLWVRRSLLCRPPQPESR